MTKLKANKPPPNCLPKAVQQPTIFNHQTSGWAVLHTHNHTHLNLLMSRCFWDTQHKSPKLLYTAWEIEENIHL